MYIYIIYIYIYIYIYKAVEKGGHGGASHPTIFWSKMFFPHEIGKHKIFTCE